MNSMKLMFRLRMKNKKFWVLGYLATSRLLSLPSLLPSFDERVVVAHSLVRSIRRWVEESSPRDDAASPRERLPTILMRYQTAVSDQDAHKYHQNVCGHTNFQNCCDGVADSPVSPAIEQCVCCFPHCRLHLLQ